MEESTKSTSDGQADETGDGLSEYVREIKKLRGGRYYYILAATVAPGDDGRPLIIPMMIGEGLDRVTRIVSVETETGGPAGQKGMDVRDAFVQCLGHIAKFGFSELPWEGVDKSVVAMQLLQAMQVTIPGMPGGSEPQDHKEVIKP